MFVGATAVTQPQIPDPLDLPASTPVAQEGYTQYPSFINEKTKAER